MSQTHSSPIAMPQIEGDPEQSRSAVGGVYRFRRFEVEVGNRMLKRDGTAVEIGGRAFDLLVALVHNKGTVVSKRKLIDAVWPSTIVDETNLRFQLSCLRQVLGVDGDMIKTVKGCGYLFVAETRGAVEMPRANPNPTWQAPQSLQAHRAGPATVAVIDDEESTRDALDSLLRSSGYMVETYTSSQTFMDSLSFSVAECLILDVWLPGRNGLEFQADLKAFGSDLPIVFISGQADIPMSVKAMKRGAVEFLTKPVRHEELLEAIEGAISARRISDEKDMLIRQ